MRGYIFHRNIYGAIASIMFACIAAHAHAEDLPTLDDPFLTQKKIEGYGKNLKPATCPPLPDTSKALTLDQVITAALCHNPEARSAYLGLLVSADNYDTTFFTPYFTDIVVNRNVSSSAIRSDKTIVDSADTLDADGNPVTKVTTSSKRTLTHERYIKSDDGLSISAGATLYDFGKRDRALATAERGLVSAGLSYESSLQGYIVSAFESYVSVLTAQNALSIGEENIALAKDTLDVAETRYKLGMIALPDLLEARTNYASAELTLQTSKNSLETSQSALAFLIGLPPLTKLSVENLDDASLMTPPFKNDLLELIKKAKAQRIDLRQARIGLQDAEDAYTDMKRRGLPSVTARATRSYENWNLSHESSRVPRDVATINVSIPIFTGFSAIFSERAQRKNLEKTRISLEQTERNLEKEILTTWQNYYSNRRSYEITQESLKTARLRQSMQLQRYKEGLISMLELSSAQIAYRNALNDAVTSRNTLLTSRIGLVQAVGELDLNAMKPLTQTTPDLAPVLEYKLPVAQNITTPSTTESPHEKNP